MAPQRPWHRRDWTAVAVLFTIALGVRLLYLAQLPPPFLSDVGIIKDAQYYDMRAQEIAAGFWVGSTPGYLSPLYCFLLGGIYAIFGGGVTVAKLVQAVLGAASCALLFIVARQWCQRWVSALASGLLAIYGLHVFYTGVLLPTVLVVFLNLLALVLFARQRRALSPLRCLIGGGVIGLAAAAKTNALLLLPLVLIWLWTINRTFPPGRRAKLCMMVVLGAVLAIGPFTWKNYKASGQFVLISTTTGRNLLKGNGPTATGTHTNLIRLGGRKSGIVAHTKGKVDPQRPALDSKRMTAEAWAYVCEHPGKAAAMLARKFKLFWNARELVGRDNFYFAQDTSGVLRTMFVSFGLLAPVGVTGLLMSWPTRRSFALVYGFLFVQVFTFVLVFVVARYRLVAVACLTLFAAQQFAWWIDWVTTRAWRKLLVSIALLTGVTLFIHLPLPEFPRERGLTEQYAYLTEYYLMNNEPMRAARLYQRAMVTGWDNGVHRRECFQQFVSIVGQLDRPEDRARALRELLTALERRGVHDVQIVGAARQMLEDITRRD